DFDILKAFCELSYDRNPLHVDAAYSRRTQFGRPVMFGMAAVLCALGEWAKGRSFRLEHIRVQFKKPIFPDENYELNVTEEDNRVTVKISKGGTIRLKCSWSWSTNSASRDPAKSAFEALPEASHLANPEIEIREWLNREFSYHFNESKVA